MRQQYPNSWVFYSSDHGQELGGKSGKFNYNPHLDTIHNPLLISACDMGKSWLLNNCA
jgi:glucan phosphoethanolaminetransferase (alkaline phosphatase superfamily)